MSSHHPPLRPLNLKTPHCFKRVIAFEEGKQHCRLRSMSCCREYVSIGALRRFSESCLIMT